jgi:acyl dehydratase
MVSNRHILRQSSALGALGRTAMQAALQKIQGVPKNPPPLPSPELTSIVPPRPRDLVDAYIRNVGGNPKAYAGRVPGHMFPQWGFGPSARTLDGIPYALMNVVNGGCRIEMRGDLPDDVPLTVTAQLMGIDDDGRKAILSQRVVTGVEGNPEIIVAHMDPIVIYGKRDPSKPRPKKVIPTVPQDAHEIARWRISRGAGLDFARLTGDFNPIHWVRSYARMSGFKSTILHGFGTMARAIEGLHKSQFAGATPVRGFDCRFTRPLTLPGDVGLYVRHTDTLREVWVGKALGGECFMSGTYRLEGDS